MHPSNMGSPSARANKESAIASALSVKNNRQRKLATPRAKRMTNSLGNGGTLGKATARRGRYGRS